MPGKALREKQHPAKRSFQAIRIAVNDELGALSEKLAEAERLFNEFQQKQSEEQHNNNDEDSETS